MDKKEKHNEAQPEKLIKRAEKHGIDYDNVVLEVRNLKKYFYVGSGRDKLTVPAVDNVSFDIHKREVFGLVGESGCGKTTTGRTIIKLYKPTDGYVKLEDDFVTAGYDSNLARIKEIKRARKDKILALDPYRYEQKKLRDKADLQIKVVQDQMRRYRINSKDEVKNAKAPISDYQNEKYSLKNKYNIDTDKLKYEANLEKQKLKDLTINSAREEFNQNIDIAKTTFNRKTEGVKESAALSKEAIDERLKDIKNEYEETVKQLKITYEPLIEQAELEIKKRSEIRPQIRELKKQLKQDLKARKEEYIEKRDSLVAPDRREVSQNVKDVKKRQSEQMANFRNQIKEINAQYKVEAKKLEEKRKQDPPKIDREEVKRIKKEAKELIKEERDKIRSIKQLNKSKESDEAARRMQMIFQDPIASLNPRMTVKEIVGEGLIIQGGYSKEEIDERVKEALELVGLSADYATRYPHEFSGGQRQRIGIARALIMDPTFIIADEPISALDVSIQAQVINLLQDLKEELGLTILFIAHDLSVVRFFCDKIAVMYFGKIVEIAESEELFHHPMHPYTISLLSAIPQPDPDYEKGRTRISYNPMMHNYVVNKPSLREIAPGHMVLANDEEFEQMKKTYEEQTAHLREIGELPEEEEKLEDIEKQEVLTEEEPEKEAQEEQPEEEVQEELPEKDVQKEQPEEDVQAEEALESEEEVVQEESLAEKDEKPEAPAERPAEEKVDKKPVKTAEKPKKDQPISSKKPSKKASQGQDKNKEPKKRTKVNVKALRQRRSKFRKGRKG